MVWIPHLDDVHRTLAPNHVQESPGRIEKNIIRIADDG